MPRVVENKLLREKVYCYRTDEGLDVFVVPKKGYNKKYATYSTNFGSINSRFVVEGEGQEVEVPDGVAHFLEHKLFEDEEGNVFDRFAALGASSNAFTGSTHTTYLFSTTENFTRCLEILLDFVQTPYFTDESVEKERGIIEQEIRMYEDDPGWRIYFNLLGALYQKHPVKKDIAGSVESIRQITKDVLYQCYRTFYHPSNMILFVVGDVDAQGIFKQVENNLKKYNYRPLGEIKNIFPPEPEAIAESYVEQRLAVSQPMLDLGFKELDVGYDGKPLLRREIVTSLMLEIVFGHSSRLINELYEKGLVNDDFDAAYVAEIGYGHSIIGGETTDPQKLLEELTAGIKRAQKEGIKEEVFEHHRRKRMGEFIKSFNTLEYIANYGGYHFRGINFFDYLQVLQDITVKDVNERLHEHLNSRNMACSVILPVD